MVISFLTKCDAQIAQVYFISYIIIALFVLNCNSEARERFWKYEKKNEKDRCAHPR